MFILLLDKDGNRTLANTDYIVAIRELDDGGAQIYVRNPDDKVQLPSVNTFQGIFDTIIKKEGRM